MFFFFFSSRRRHTRCSRDWSSDVCSSDLGARDTLRLEMKYALYGNDIDDTTNALEAGLGWGVKPAKGIGRGSGRGRGEISGVAVSFKKKKKKESEAYSSNCRQETRR